MSKAKDLSRLFSPRSIAVIGASATSGKVGAIVLKNIINSGFPGKVYPVNPNAENINDLKCFKTILDLPEVVDLAVIAIPAASVNEVLSQIGEKGVKNVVIYSAGFKEIGEDGKKLENQLIEIANKYALNILGPNCLGFVN
ncbi:CoA-binding protein, partial [Patescibacteria group bacterium]|nr:CoA-binding protein [Patescibacteria group bacterium]